MTTLVALPTKDAVVMGCDSLGTVSQPMIDSIRLLSEFFDFNSGDLILDDDGKPRLRSVSQVLDLTSQVPFDHMTDVDKMFSLEPLAMGVMFTGTTSIEDRTIKSLLGDFKAGDKAFLPETPNFTVKSVGERLLEHIRAFYEEAFGDIRPEFRPPLELILAGYDKSGPHPRVAKIDLRAAEVSMQEPPFSPVFGGQSREIERIVYGIDIDGYIRIEERHEDLMRRYALKVAKANGVEDPKLSDPGKDFRIFGKDFGLPSMAANWGNFSEQNAIDCVAYFVRIMRGAQRFSARMPTVGGAIHVALVDRETGFRFISRREYAHEDHRVPRA